MLKPTMILYDLLVSIPEEIKLFSWRLFLYSKIFLKLCYHRKTICGIPRMCLFHLLTYFEGLIKLFMLLEPIFHQTSIQSKIT